MMLRKPISSWLTVPRRQGMVFARFGRLCWLAIVVISGSVSALAKDAPATVVALFDGTAGAAYVQLVGMTLNGKTEVRLCDGVSRFDKSAYNALPRAPFTGATSLQRGEDGVLTLTVDTKTLCIVPSNLKFDKKPEFTPA